MTPKKENVSERQKSRHNKTITWWGCSRWTAGFIHDSDASASSKHCHPEFAVEWVSHDAKQLIAGVSGHAVNKQTEEDGSQDLTEQHSQARLRLLAC